jgi:hypothetical protein
MGHKTMLGIAGVSACVFLGLDTFFRSWDAGELVLPFGFRPLS